MDDQIPPMGVTPHAVATEMADRLNAALDKHQLATFAPDARKFLRLFQAGEVAELLGVSPQFLRNLHAEHRIPEATEVRGGRRYYSAQLMLEIRQVLEATASKNKGSYVRGRRPHESMLLFSLVNFKGGSAKTTTVAHLSHALALKGYRVLVVDLDPQASLTSLFGFRPELDLENELTAYDALRYDNPVSVRDVAIQTYFPNISLIAGELQLQTYEHETAAVIADKSRRDTPFYLRLAVALEDVKDDFDVVLIDCPPQLGFLTIAAAVASTSVIVPVVPSMLDLASTAMFLRMMGELLEVIERQGVAMTYDEFKFLLSRFEPNDAPQQEMATFLRSLFRDQVMVSTALKSTAISDASLWNQTLYEVERTQLHRSTYDRAMESLSSVADEVEAMMHRAWRR